MGSLLSGGGGSGGLLGNLGFSVGAHELPIVGGLFANPDEQYKQQQMNQAHQAYTAYRPEAAQARMNAMRQAGSMMQPANNALAAMYGPGATAAMPTMNPMSPRMMGLGGPQGSGPAGPAMTPISGPSGMFQRPGLNGVLERNTQMFRGR